MRKRRQLRNQQHEQKTNKREFIEFFLHLVLCNEWISSINALYPLCDIKTNMRTAPITAKTVSYFSDGMGRDSYIYFNNGGLTVPSLP